MSLCVPFNYIRIRFYDRPSKLFLLSASGSCSCCINLPNFQTWPWLPYVQHCLPCLLQWSTHLLAWFTEFGMAAPLLCSHLQLSLEHPFLNVPQVCTLCSLCPGPFHRWPSQLKMPSPPPWTNPTPNFCSPSTTLCTVASAPPNGKSLPCGPGLRSFL